MSTDLYHRIIEQSKADHDGGALMRKVWAPTPWMVDAYTGGFGRHRDREMAIQHWCIKRFGPEASPIHGHEGRWQRGGATIHGRTWMGFATEKQMNEFLAAWPDPEDES